jgi:hypothetical protein
MVVQVSSLAEMLVCVKKFRGEEKLQLLDSEPLKA